MRRLQLLPEYLGVVRIGGDHHQQSAKDRKLFFVAAHRVFDFEAAPELAGDIKPHRPVFQRFDPCNVVRHVIGLLARFPNLLPTGRHWRPARNYPTRTGYAESRKLHSRIACRKIATTGAVVDTIVPAIGYGQSPTLTIAHSKIVDFCELGARP